MPNFCCLGFLFFLFFLLLCLLQHRFNTPVDIIAHKMHRLPDRIINRFGIRAAVGLDHGAAQAKKRRAAGFRR